MVAPWDVVRANEKIIQDALDQMLVQLQDVSGLVDQTNQSYSGFIAQIADIRSRLEALQRTN